jgi:hypothetical protein
MNSSLKIEKQERDKLKIRALSIGHKLGNDYLADMMQLYPKYNNPSGKKRIMDVKNGNVISLEITEALEAYAAKKERMLKEIESEFQL